MNFGAGPSSRNDKTAKRCTILNGMRPYFEYDNQIHVNPKLSQIGHILNMRDIFPPTADVKINHIVLHDVQCINCA